MSIAPERNRRATAGGGGGAAPPPNLPGLPPLPPTFPPGVNPETYQIEKVTGLLKAAAYFPIFNVPNAARPNQPVLLLPFLPQVMIAVLVNEELHRFEVVVEAGAAGLRAANRVGQPIADVHIRWTPVPDDFEGAPGLLPPPTILNPFRSQRFSMLDGQLTFKDRQGSGFRAFGCGRTFPATVGGQQVLYIGAVIDVLEGSGKLAGLPGATYPGATMVVNGYIQPPDNLALNLMVRVMDPGGQLTVSSPLSPLLEVPDPDPNAVFLFFLGEPDPDRPVELILGRNGMPIGSRVFERLRLLRIGYDATSRAGLESRYTEGPVVGTVAATLYFDFLDPRPVFPIQTREGVFTFFGPGGRGLGTIAANMVEGRAFRTELPGAPMPVFRFGGFGPISGGTGELSGARGMMTMNSAISVFPRTLSNLYILRVEDPTGKVRSRVAGGLT